MQQVLSGAHKTVTYWLEITPKVHDRSLKAPATVAKLAKAGFDNIDIDPTRVYSIPKSRRIEDWMPHWTLRR
jgi:hypothetical protein